MALFEGLARQRELRQRAAAAGGMPAPQYDANTLGAFQGAAASGAGALGSARGAQADALGMYRQMASGQGPSVAELQMQRGGDQAIANSMAMAAQGRSGNLGSSMRQAGQAGAAIGMQTNADAANLRAQEQQAAMAGYAGLGSTMADQGLQQQMGALGLQGAAQGQQLGASTQWGLGQREMDIRQIEANRRFGLGVTQQMGQAAKNVGGLL